MDSTKLYTTKEAGTFLGRPPHTLKVYVQRERLFPLSHDQLPEDIRKTMRAKDYIFTEQELRRFKSASRKKRSDAGKSKTRPKNP